MDLHVPMIKPLYARSIVVWAELAEIWDLPFSLSIYRKPPYYILTEACCWNGTLKVSLKWDTPEAGGLMEQERGWEKNPWTNLKWCFGLLGSHYGMSVSNFLSVFIHSSFSSRSISSPPCYKGVILKDRKPKFPSLELTLWCFTTLSRMCLPLSHCISWSRVTGLETWLSEYRAF